MIIECLMVDPCFRSSLSTVSSTSDRTRLSFLPYIDGMLMTMTPSSRVAMFRDSLLVVDA